MTKVLELVPALSYWEMSIFDVLLMVSRPVGM